MKNITLVLLFSWVISGCALIIQGNPAPNQQGKTEDTGTQLSEPECGKVLRELLDKKYSGEADPKVKIDQDLDGPGIGFEGLNFSSEQRACLDHLKAGDFVSSVETSLKHHEAVGVCPSSQLIAASVETSLKYAEACRMSLDSSWKRGVKVAASVETYLKFGEATRESDAYRHRVFSGVETFLKYSEAITWFEYQEQYREIPDQERPSFQDFRTQNQSGSKMFASLDGSFSSLETYLKFFEAIASFGADRNELRAGLTRYHITDPESISKVNEFIAPAHPLELRADPGLIHPADSLDFYQDCNSSDDFNTRIGSKGIILNKSDFWSSTGAHILEALGFQHSSVPCVQSGPAARFTRNLYKEDFDQLLDKGAVSNNQFPMSHLVRLGFVGVRALDKGMVLRDSLSETDFQYLQDYFFFGKEFTTERCYETSPGYNFETGECSTYEIEKVSMLEQADRFLDKGLVAPSLKNAAMMTKIIAGTPENHDTHVGFRQSSFPEAIDRILDKGVAGTPASPLLASMFVKPNGAEIQWADRVLDRGIYFDGTRFRSIENYLKYREEK